MYVEEKKKIFFIDYNVCFTFIFFFNFDKICVYVF